MKLTPEDMQAACDEVERATAFLNEDAKWDLLRDWLRDQEDHSREEMRRMLLVELLGYALAPTVAKKKWRKALDRNRPLERRVHELRLAATRAPEPVDGGHDSWGPFGRR